MWILVMDLSQAVILTHVYENDWEADICNDIMPWKRRPKKVWKFEKAYLLHHWLYKKVAEEKSKNGPTNL